jgi:DHA1 family tetracycline resistance protein-like MFS transporter
VKRISVPTVADHDGATFAVVSRQRSLAVLWLTVFVDQLGFGIVVPFLPLYANKLGASGFEVGLALAVYSLAQMLVSQWWGRLSDRVGRRPVLVAGAIGTCVGFLVIANATSLPMVFVGRAILGSFGIGMQTAQAWVADTTPPEGRGRALALLGAAGGLGFVLGPAIGALGILAGGMRLPFFLAAGFAAANAILARTVLPRSTPIAPIGQPTKAAGWRSIVPCLIVAFVLTYAFSGVEATFALFTKAALGFQPADNGWLFGAMALISVVTQAFGTRWLAGKLGEAARVGMGLVILGVGVGAMPSATSLGTLLLPVALLAIGYSIVAPSLAAWISRRAPADRQGELLGLAQSTSALARVAGPGIGGWLFDHVGRAVPFHVAAIVIGGSAVVAIAARRR